MSIEGPGPSFPANPPAASLLQCECSKENAAEMHFLKDMLESFKAVFEQINEKAVFNDL